MADRATEHEIPAEQPGTSPRRHALEKKLKATIQYFNEGMWDNKLYYPSK
ncbi:hypothetical protein ACES2J_13440 [Bdellovibrio bacteriovorus]